MRVLNLYYIFLLALVCLQLVHARRPDFMNLRRRYHRNLCMARRCFHLHSRVPFP